MVERCRRPAVHRVTDHARGGEITRNVVRVRSVVEISLMTVDAVVMESGKDVVDMAAGARHGLMRAGQWKRSGGMVERRRGPDTRRMALIAGVGEISSGMIWARRRRKIRLVTHVTIRIRELEVIVHMARSARDGNVGSR